MTQPTAHRAWSSRTAFLLAAIGAAVGLGNLWRFPFIAGQNGGAAFVLVYVGCVALIGVPVIAAELVLGRRGHGSPIATMRNLVRDERAAAFWHTIGWLSLLIPMLGMIYYSVVAGWSLDYVTQAAIDRFAGIDAEGSEGLFDELLASPPRLLLWNSIYIGGVVAVVGSGLRRGIERTFKWMMPSLFAMLLLMVGYAALEGEFVRGLQFVFEPDFSALGMPGVLMALGQAFFSLAIGVGAMITYGAYLPREVSLPFGAAVIAIADTLVALLAGLAIFPLVFAFDLSPDQGPGLIFVTLPVAFGQMPAGQIIATLFFMLLAFAAFSSSVGMLEPVVCWLEEHRRASRPWLAFYAGGLGWLFGIVIVLSFNIWSQVRPLAMIELLARKNIFELLDFVVANLLIPINGLLIALFAGWAMSRDSTLEELGIGDGPTYRYWRFAIRFVAPVAIGAVLISVVRESLR